MKKFAFFTLKKEIFEIIPTNFSKNQALTEKNRFFCAVSGGQDSILSFFLLFHILFMHEKNCKKQTVFYNFLSKNQFDGLEFNEKNLVKTKFYKNRKSPKISIVYCQHFWQTKNFFNMELLFQLCFVMEIPYTVILPKCVLMAENRSRDWRKKNFFRFLQFQEISKLVTGHTKSDTFEKNLTNLFRGTSPKSISQNVKFDSKKTIIMFFSFFIFKPLRSPYCYFSNKNKFIYIFFFTNLKNLRQKRIVKNFTNENLAKPKPNKQKLNFVFFRKSSILKKYVSKYNQIHRETTLPPSLEKGATKTKSIFCFLDKEIFFSLSTFQRVDLLYFSHEFQITNSYSNNFVFFYRDLFSWSFCFSNNKFKDKKTFIKPLEKINRSSISKIINLYNFPKISDFTNFDTSFSRNKVRHHILPFMKIFGQKKVESLMTKFFYLVNQDNHKLTYEICEFKVFLEFLRDQTSNLKIDLEIILISKVHISIKQLLLQNLVLKYREIELNFRHIVFLENSLNTKY